MHFLKPISLILLIVGGLNWGLVGLFGCAEAGIRPGRRRVEQCVEQCRVHEAGS